MAVWQKRARLGVAVFGIACAVIVYFAIGRRPPPTISAPIKRIDPTATAESTGGSVLRFREDRRDFELKYETQLLYNDGTSVMRKTTILVKKPDGHSYAVTAGEARSTQDQKHLQLSSGVHLQASDGFAMTADRATYDKDLGTIHSDVPVTFSKARMSGSGTAIDYNENSDVLTVNQDAKVTTVDESGATVLDFAAGSAVLDRLNDLLTLNGHVHVLRDQQTMDGDRAVAHLAPKEEFVTFLELRGNSKVEGGGGTLDAMSARDIDLDYTDDGKALERVTLNGTAGVTLVGSNGSPGRKLAGESLDIRLGPDGSVLGATGRENVRMLLPATADSPGREIHGKTLDATGAPGAGLNAVHVSDAVEYREDATQTTAGRTVHSRRLDLGLSGDIATDATFTDDVTFEEPAFRAQAANARYDPSAGTLHLNGSDKRGLPCLADDQISVDAQTIDVTVETRRLKAVGGVKTTLRPGGASGGVGSSPCAVALQKASSSQAARPQQPGSDTRLPGLLKQDQIASANGESLDYGGTGQTLVFTGASSLVQGGTSIRGNLIRIDQQRGDLVVSGNARYTSQGDDNDSADGRAEEIRYTDADRRISYLNRQTNAAKPANGTVLLAGSQRTLQAEKIDVFLEKEGGHAQRLEAYQRVTAKIESKTVTADRLTYLADEDRYDMKGAGLVPVRIVDGCSENSGKTVTYYKGNNRIVTDGNDESRTLTKSGGCSQTPASSR